MRTKGLGKTVTLVGAALLACLPVGASSQTLSDDCSALLTEIPITVVVPNEAGGGYDIYARAFASALEEIVARAVRVSNMPAAGGRLAYAEVAQQDQQEIVLLIENLGDLVTTADTDDALGVKSDAFAALGILVSEPSVWLGRPDIDLSDPAVNGLVVGANSVSSTLIEAGVVGRALGLNLRAVAGYDGSSETTAAVLRNETDFAVLTVTTALRRSEGNDLKILLVLQDKPHADAPDAFVLGGKDGLVEVRSAGLSESERAARREMADTAIALAVTHRAVITGSHLDDGVTQCLRAATDIVLQGSTLAKTAQDQGRPIDPTLSDQSAGIYTAVRESQALVLDQLEALEAELVE